MRFMKQLGGFVTLIAFLLLQSGCLTQTVWSELDQSTLNGGMVVGVAKVEGNATDEYAIACYSPGQRCVAFPLGSRDNPSMFVLIGASMQNNVASNSSEFFSSRAVGISDAQVRYVAGTVIESWRFSQAEKLKSSSSYRSLIPRKFYDTADVPDSAKWLGSDEDNGVEAFKLSLKDRGRTGLDAAQTRFILIPEYPQLSRLERGLRKTTAVVLTPVTVAVDVVTIPIQVLFLLIARVR
jgi:hypothetical protein